ncbi:MULTISPECIES: signal peptidase I [Mammaliicoccus]|jgi:signal peptidase I|nr:MULTISPECIES: signal peptidase I [Mammaliicoccus]HBV04553.1 signal peptidase I [Staphylococcus sp.]POA05500.1 signal peptidase I [Mammaliicoccus lentus]TFU58866.1 signal peptidase I [Mammaliicoccus lentus]SCU39106.1 Signal peptidase I [Mammaliicoccus lentus]SUM52494.1 Signal peptidase I [Mammaliicoccus lentus]
MRKIYEWLIAIIIAFALLFLVRAFLFVGYVVNGESMEPTFYDKERVIVNKLVKNIGQIDNGDVIVFHANKNEDYIKRVIGLPGDTVEMKNNKLYINGTQVNESYLKDGEKTPNFNTRTIQGSKSDVIPNDEYLVLGDNRNNSRDSREIGFVYEKDIVGKVNLRYYPFDRIDTNFDK